MTAFLHDIKGFPTERGSLDEKMQRLPAKEHAIDEKTAAL